MIEPLDREQFYEVIDGKRVWRDSREIVDKINELIASNNSLHQRLDKLDYIVNRMDAGMFGIEYEQNKYEQNKSASQ